MFVEPVATRKDAYPQVLKELIAKYGHDGEVVQTTGNKSCVAKNGKGKKATEEHSIHYRKFTRRASYLKFLESAVHREYLKENGKDAEKGDVACGSTFFMEHWECFCHRSMYVHECACAICYQYSMYVQALREVGTQLHGCCTGRGACKTKCVCKKTCDCECSLCKEGKCHEVQAQFAHCGAFNRAMSCDYVDYYGDDPKTSGNCWMPPARCLTGACHLCGPEHLVQCKYLVESDHKIKVSEWGEVDTLKRTYKQQVKEVEMTVKEC